MFFLESYASQICLRVHACSAGPDACRHWTTLSNVHCTWKLQIYNELRVYCEFLNTLETISHRSILLLFQFVRYNLEVRRLTHQFLKFNHLCYFKRMCCLLRANKKNCGKKYIRSLTTSKLYQQRQFHCMENTSI